MKSLQIKEDIMLKNSDNSDNVDLMNILFQFFRNWKLIVAIISVFLLISIIYVLISPKEYSSDTAIQLIKSDKNKLNNPIDMESLGLMSTTNNIDNEFAILKSPDLVLQVVKELGLHYQYFIKNKLRTIDIYRASPYSVKLDNDSILMEAYVELSLLKTDSKGYKVQGSFYNEENEEKFSVESLTLPIQITVKGVVVTIDNATTQKDISVYEEIFVKIQNPISVADQYAGSLRLSQPSKYASIINIGITTNNPVKSKEILEGLVKVYNAENMKDKNEAALNTALFINERIVNIGVELGDVERDVEGYKKTQGITDLSSEAKLYMEQSALNQNRLVDIETQIRIVNMIADFVEDPQKDSNPIPNNVGLTDPSLEAMITDYNTKILTYNSILVATNKENPTRQRIQIELNTIRESILSQIKNVRTALQITKKDIEVQRDLGFSKINSLPTLERGLIEKMRQQQIKQDLYLFLLQKREETNIMMASNSDKAKVVTRARIDNVPVAPRSKMFVGMFLLLGLFTSVIVVYVKGLLDNKIGGKEELERLTDIPVISSIIKNSDNQPIVVKKGSDSAIVELFRYLRNRIEFIFQNDSSKKVILVTSTIAGEGKTFIASNLGCVFAINDKKVLLVGMDIRNPQLGNTFDLQGRFGLTDYISGNKNSWKDLLVSPTDNSNLDVLMAGTIPPNPNELLKSKKINSFIEEAKNEYDIVILDTAPVGIISDTYSLCQYADCSLYVVREKNTLKSTVKFINEEYRKNIFKNMYIVLNNVDPQNITQRYGVDGYGYNKK